MDSNLTRLWKSLREAPVVRRLWLSVFVVAVVSEIFVFVVRTHLPANLRIESSVHTVLGLVLGLFLAFRTNTSYDRWWEGRKLWGQLVNDLRNLSMKTSEFVQVDAVGRRQFADLLTSFAYALKDHLRGLDARRHIPPFLKPERDPDHVPGYLARQVYQRLLHWKHEGHIDGFEMLAVDIHGRSLMDVCGACERIQKTPIARSYLTFVRQCIAIYLLTLPVGLIKDLGVWTGLAVAIVAYFMIGVELIAEDVEDPFGHDTDDLRLDDICATIRRSVDSTLA